MIASGNNSLGLFLFSLWFSRVYGGIIRFCFLFQAAYGVMIVSLYNRSQGRAGLDLKSVGLWQLYYYYYKAIETRSTSRSVPRF